MASYRYELAELGDDAHGLGCSCCRFTNGLDLPSPSKLTIDEIKSHRLRFATSIFSDWIKLNAVVKRFEGTIQKRWLKKGNKQRRDILLKAWPNMAACHRPDFAGFRKRQIRAPRSRTCPSEAYLWPYINVEDLTQKTPLLLFINSRGRSLPECFISADIEAAHLGKGWQFLADDESDSMDFYNRHSPLTYGRVIGVLEDLPRQTSLGNAPVNSVIRYHPSLGLLGLEIQAGIYRFLLQCASLILHDIEPSRFYLAPHQPAPPPFNSERRDFSTLQDHALEAPYQAPQSFDLDRLKLLVAARRSAAEEHILSLREDPGYFVDTLKEEREHNSEYTHRCPGTWRKVSGLVITDAITYFLFWDKIHQLLQRMIPLESQLKRADYNAVRLYPVDERIWAALDEIINLLLIIPLARLRVGFPLSPRMRHAYGPNKDEWVFRSSRSEAERRVDVVFHAIADNDQRSLHSLHHLVQEAQLMIDTEPDASDLVDAWLAGHFADLALISELKTRIDSLEPFASGWRSDCGSDDCVNCAQIASDVVVLLQVDDRCKALFQDACRETKLDDPTGQAWRYPADKRPSESTITQMRQAERLLDDYWKEIDKLVWCDKKDMDMRKAFKCYGFGLGGGKLHRTAPWKKPLVLPTLVETQPSVILCEVSVNTWAMPRVSEHLVIPKKVKVKTRGRSTPMPVPTPTDDVAEDLVADPVPDETQTPLVTIKVPKRAYKVLSALLPPVGQEYHYRPEIAWDELLYAMLAIGLQPEKLYGSVWIFAPVPKGECKIELDLKRSIQFHEPKEVRRGNKIGKNMLRVFGRRLTHAFGFEAGMFECE